MILTINSLLLHLAPLNRRNQQPSANPPQQQPPANAPQGQESRRNSGGSAGGNPPVRQDNAPNADEYTTFTIQEYPILGDYVLTSPECTSFAQFLATTQPYLLHNIDFLFRSIPDNTQNLQWDRIVPSLLERILGNANYIDSVLMTSRREDGTIEEPSLRVILNKLICLVIIAKYGIFTERDDAAYILHHSYLKLRICYIQVLGMNIPPGDLQLYINHHQQNNLRTTITQDAFVAEEDARKRTVYCGADARLFGLMFNVAVGSNYRQTIDIDTLVAPPPGILPVLPMMSARDGFATRLNQRLRVNHVYPYVSIPSVKIYPDGRMEENRQGYPQNPRIAQQLANPADMLMDEEDVRIVDLLDDEDDDPELTVIDYRTVKPTPFYSHDRTARRFRHLSPERTALNRYVEFGTIWHQQNNGPSAIVKVMRKNHADVLKKHKQHVYGSYPPNFNISQVKPKLRKHHEFTLKGHKGLAILDHFPKSLSDCHQYACMEGVPASTADPLVSSICNAIQP